MSDLTTIKPAEGCTVLCPDTYEPLSADGKAIVLDSYWIRRLNDGDVIEVKPADSGQKKTAGDK